jgi:plastocyanin
MASSHHRRAWGSVLVTSLVALAGCGGGSGGGGGTSATASASAAPASAKVRIQGYAYHAPTVTVRAGGTVTFTNKDSTKHTATATGDRPSFDTDGLATGASKRITFAHPGRYAYICSYHPFMHGTVVVR